MPCHRRDTFHNDSAIYIWSNHGWVGPGQLYCFQKRQNVRSVGHHPNNYRDLMLLWISAPPQHHQQMLCGGKRQGKQSCAVRDHNASSAQLACSRTGSMAEPLADITFSTFTPHHPLLNFSLPTHKPPPFNICWAQQAAANQWMYTPMYEARHNLAPRIFLEAGVREYVCTYMLIVGWSRRIPSYLMVK